MTTNPSEPESASESASVSASAGFVVGRGEILQMLEIPLSARLAASSARVFEALDAQIRDGEMLTRQPIFRESPRRRAKRANAALRWHSDTVAIMSELLLPTDGGLLGARFPDYEIMSVLPSELRQLSALRARLTVGRAGVAGPAPVVEAPVVEAPVVEAPAFTDPDDASFAAESVAVAPPEFEAPLTESAAKAASEADHSLESSPGDTPLERILIAQAASAALPVYDADSASERDYIGIGAVADAFAYLIASRTSQPPLAIGLFGEWGSGKSFLMSAIKNRVDQITRAARESDLPPDELGVHKRVVQVEFNAWHYVEGNLWASLVDHIFANLRVTPEESSTTLETRRKAINDKLASTTAQREVLEQRITQLEKERQVKDNELSSLRTKQRANLEQARKITLGDVAAATKLGDADKRTVNDALGAVGLGSVDDTAVEAVAALSDAREVARRGGAILAPLRGRGLWWLALVVLAICVAPAAAFLLQHFNVATAPKVLTSIAASASAGVALFHNGARWMSSVVGRIEIAESAVRARVDQTLAEQARDLAAIQQNIDKTEADLADALSKRQNAQQLIDDLKREKTGLTPGKILSEFLDARASSRDYQKHLGLTSLIRRDFEELSRLIKAVHDGPDGGIADFSRVVLFVDDLDRCPPARVVEVLQAVHLLLSFPVFAVVVAVDPRWLSRSLQQHFAGLIDDGDDRLGDMSTAQDYLEKIFQIPYRVGPLDDPARRLFLRGMLAEVLHKPSIPEPPPLSTLPIDDELLGRLTGQEGDPVDPGLDGGPTSDFHSWSFEQDRNTEVLPPVEVDLSPSSLELDEHEAAYLDQLLPILDSSPRGLKRYVNIYRLIKTVLAGRDAPTDVTAQAAAERRMFLLAIVTSMTCGAELATYLAATEPAKAPDAATVSTRTAEYFASPRAARHAAEGAVLQDWLNRQSLLAAAPAGQVTADAQHIRLYSFV